MKQLKKQTFLKITKLLDILNDNDKSLINGYNNKKYLNYVDLFLINHKFFNLIYLCLYFSYLIK